MCDYKSCASARHLRFGIKIRTHPDDMQWLDDGFRASQNCEWKCSCSLPNLGTSTHYANNRCIGYDSELNMVNFNCYSLCSPELDTLHDEEEIECMAFVDIIQWVNANNKIFRYKGMSEVQMKAETEMIWDLGIAGAKDLNVFFMGAEFKNYVLDEDVYDGHDRFICSPLSDDKCWFIQLDPIDCVISICWHRKPQEISILAFVSMVVFWEDGGMDMKQDCVVWEAQKSYDTIGNLRGRLERVWDNLAARKKIKKIKVTIRINKVWDSELKGVAEGNWKEYGIIQECKTID